MNTLQTLKNDDMQIKWKNIWYARHIIEHCKEAYENIKNIILEMADKIKIVFNSIVELFGKFSEDDFRIIRQKLGRTKKLSTSYPHNVNNYVNNVNKKLNTRGYAPSFMPRCRSTC